MSISTLSQSHSIAPTITANARSLQLVSTRVAATPDTSAIPRISSQLLLDGGRELVIQHQGGEYHLRLTRNDKLILTK
ncbi:hemin uptake protein HemP [Rhodanobacter sp. A1T4]|jgi:hemin uptake protein HemP|uniref:hemin uptake protein HemP n=1 Tax=Rhodanobacter sp. A1T4 TaxID=2723087 RepID=UPI0016138A46|nr:hemin uptake protein HemP [Rhodanobacter sp. A1T4]MBB6245360.1 hemin uptake protein HemP [Rhodanobacter sp. A1T4]